MNLFLLEEPVPFFDLSSSDERYVHLCKVLRLKVGQPFCLGSLNGPRGIGTVERISDQGIRVSCQWNAEPDPERPGAGVLLFPFCRPATARRIFQEGTALGIRRFLVFASDRGEAAYSQSSVWSQGEITALMRSGLEQSFRTRLPEWQILPSLAATLEETGSFDEATYLKFALDNYEATQLLIDAPGVCRSDSRPLSFCLAVGGERGWSDRERQALRASGFSLVHLGPEVLRVETAALVGFGILREICLPLTTSTPSVRTLS